MVAYTKPQQRKKEESEKLIWERDQIKFIDLRSERWQVVGLKELPFLFACSWFPSLYTVLVSNIMLT